MERISVMQRRSQPFAEKSIRKPPEKINTDKHASYPPAIEELPKEATLPTFGLTIIVNQV